MSNTFSTPITKVAVIGAGTMGAAIAQHFLMKNLDVVLIDVQQQGLERGVSNISESLDAAVQRKILSAERKEAMMRGLKASTDYETLADRHYVVEAVFENKEVKQKVFKSVEAQVSDSCLIASNTSSFSVTELGSVLKHQNRFVGAHYFYHAAKNKLIELIPGANTRPEAIDALTKFYYENDKAPITVGDVYGFAVNRFFVPWLNEAVRLYEEGLGSIAFIDEVAVDVFKVGMGPFALMNATGVPITLHASRTLEENFGPMYAPAGRLIETVDAAQQWDLSDETSPKNDREAVTNRLLAMSLGVAAQMVSEGVTGVTETDLGARLGLRWPIGPFELINQLGVTTVKDIVCHEFGKYDQKVPAIFEQADLDQGFAVEHVRAHVVNGAGLIEFNRPDAMNALNPAVMVSLEKAIDTLEDNPAIDKIVLFGRGKAFIAGADIKFFIDNIKAQALEKVQSFTAYGHQVLSKLATSKKQTIAFIDGLALGGGLELALACQNRVASPRMVAALPETGIGIYPGLGGTQRSSRVMGKARAKYLVATGKQLNAEQALAFGLVDKVVDSSSDMQEIATISVDRSHSQSASAASATIAEAHFEHFDGDISSVLSQTADFEPHRKVLSRKAPLALRKAMQLIDEGYDLSLEEGLAMELEALQGIFSTDDALSGLESVSGGAAAQFQGR
ncbi:3-hydroxyacyl-CoA dehydrogenase/enoyl-CoA hydratase family protein [Pseudomaricurvus alkylphenolicus]|uniref:3-hydroxyacyl-CoA dehydrogenase/enoyl-CoA hydratase family protein n=1 Tax=Pseudomaricurvus alkylphenolicus TaxID=1306991 RepID=UPI0014217618|nr:3-hydroxyacyl-CoA dehydrogenase/enoyl-CoA hydratase family protein [Pseudomaricurvus alkylphenolicus]NIB43460.1 3-hydroxyacyl-CoA dehydrogenase/enoyl-CoA hydratase family protein [Pseudomaricurvus alkylphenolicus]